MTTDYPIEELRVPMPWGHVAAKAWGFPNNKHILGIHGLLDNAGTFDLLIPLLPREYYFVCIDLPGHGLSSHFPATGALDFFDYILAINIVLDYLKWDTFVLMGHSFGGTLGLLYSVIYPMRIEKMIGLDSDIIPVVKNEQLGDRIRYMHDFSMNNEGSVEGKQYTKEEILYNFMYNRWSTLNITAAETLIKRSVTKVGDKYRWNHDPRLNIGVWPLLERNYYYRFRELFNTPALIILSDAISSSFDRSQLIIVSSELGLEMNTIKFVFVEGNHCVHNNYPERIVPHIVQYLSNIKSSL